MTPVLLHVVGAALCRDGRCLVARRGPDMSSPLSWEFPGGKVEAGEDPRAALRRELFEELGIDVSVGELAGTGEAVVAERRIVLDVYFAELVGGSPRPVEHSEIAWLAAPELAMLDWAAPDVPIVARVARRLEAGV